MMSSSLVYGLLLVSIFIAAVVIYILIKGRMPMKYALVWFIPSIAIIILALVPQIFFDISKIFGFQTISNLIVGFFFLMLFFIIMALTVIISGLTSKVNLLIQEVSMLKEKKEIKEKNGE